VSRTPLQGGIVVALAWIIGQIVLWAVVVVASMFLSVVLVYLLAGTLDPTNWNGMP
jgi:hypothetical protein